MKDLNSTHCAKSIIFVHKLFVDSNDFMGESGKASFGILELGEFGQVIFGIWWVRWSELWHYKLGELGKASFRMLALGALEFGELGEISFDSWNWVS